MAGITLASRIGAVLGLSGVLPTSCIVAVWFDQDEKLLQGRFRIWAKRQDFKVWRGWSGDLRVLLVGEFEARPDALRGAQVWKRTEVGGLKRPVHIGRPRRVYGPPVEEKPQPQREEPGR